MNLFEKIITPIFSAKLFTEKTDIEKRNVYRIIDFLVDKEIVYPDNKERNKTYYFDKLLEIIS